jgi:hypothetical protein
MEQHMTEKTTPGSPERVAAAELASNLNTSNSSNPYSNIDTDTNIIHLVEALPGSFNEPTSLHVLTKTRRLPSICRSFVSLEPSGRNHK